MKNVTEIVRQIKKSFHLYMNGVTSQSMRDKGIDYKVNWGIPLPQIKTIVAKYAQDSDLAFALWHDNVRECKIMATLLMPHADMTSEKADEWLDEIYTVEIAEMCAMNLFQHMADAPSLVIKWMSTDSDIKKICACHVFSRLLMKDFRPDECYTNAFLQSARTAIKSENAMLRHAMNNSLVRLADAGDNYAKAVDNVLPGVVNDIF